MDKRQPRQRYEFGDFEVDARRRVVISRVDQQELQTTAKIFDTLLYFVERPGELLDKQTLLDALWPNVVVEEANLTQTIHVLRRLLGERPDSHRYLVTVPGRGYRFVADVQVRTADEPAPDPVASGEIQHARPRWRWAALAVLVALTLIGLGGFLNSKWRVPLAPKPSTPPSIAVLAFVDMSPAHDQEHLADGLPEEILNLLAQSRDLKVIARTSSFSFKGSKADVATIANKLQVTHVLEGSIRKSKDRIRVTTQLVEGATGEHVWSESYDREFDDVFDIESDIAARVAQSLAARLAARQGPIRAETVSAEAFEDYLQGRFYFNRRGQGDVARARDYYGSALRRDPNFARAWAGLASAYWVDRDVNWRIPADAIPKWREAVERSLALGPDLAEAQLRAAQFYWMTGDEAVGTQHFNRARALGPNDPLVLVVGSGLTDRTQAIAMIRSAIAVDPLTAGYHSMLGLNLMAFQQWDEAKSEFRKSMELNQSTELNAQIVRIEILQKHYDVARAGVAQLPEGRQRDQCLALLNFATGDSAAANAALARLVATVDTHPDAELKASVAEVYAYRGDTDAAFRWLLKADRQTRNANAVKPGAWAHDFVQYSPFLRPLIDDPRMAQIGATTALSDVK